VVYRTRRCAGAGARCEKWASWENKRSFGIQREFLLDLLTKVGFDIVLEQYDIFAGNMLGGMDGHYNALDRGMFVGIRAAAKLT
jgi:hypothetical protein